MQEKKLVLYYPEADFVNRFAYYVEKRSGLPVRCRPFSDPRELSDYLKNHTADLLLLPAGTETVPDQQGDPVPVMYFTEKKESSNEWELPIYRKMDRQISQIGHVLDLAGENRQTGEFRTEIVGFYSPVHGAGQSVSAILMGMVLAEKMPVLLLNLERFSGIRQFFPAGEGSLSELLYYAKVRRDIVPHLKEAISYFGPLAYIPPVREPDDISEARAEDFCCLLTSLRDTGLYRCILVDIGEGVQRERPILELCERIYVTIREDEIALQKLLEWQSQLEASGAGDILPRLRTFRLPQPAPEKLTEYRELRHMAWGKTVKALTEGEI